MTSTPHRLAGRLGGLRDTPAKRAALAALHTARRGRRVHPEAADWPALRRRLAAAVRHPEPGRSRRAAAAACGVSDRTLRRWLAAIDLPAPERLPLIRDWLQ